MTTLKNTLLEEFLKTIQNLLNDGEINIALNYSKGSNEEVIINSIDIYENKALLHLNRDPKTGYGNTYEINMTNMPDLMADEVIGQFVEVN